MTGALTTVRSFSCLPEAEAARMALQGEGITAFLFDSETVNMDWLLGNAVGYIKLQVPAAQAEAARACLEPVPVAPAGPAHEGGAEPTTCLSCGAPLPADRDVCPACGWSYAAPDGAVPAEAHTGAAGSAAADAADGPERRSLMERLRSWRRPLFLILLAGEFFVLACLVFGALAWLAELVAHLGRLPPGR